MTDKDLYGKLTYKRKNVFDEISPDEKRKVLDLADEYRVFLDSGKTERECVDKIVNTIEEAGYISIEQAIKNLGGICSCTWVKFK